MKDKYFLDGGGRNPERIDRIIKKLWTLWHRCPDARLGQLLQNYAWPENHPMNKPRPRDIFHYEDNVTEERLDEALKQ